MSEPAEKNEGLEADTSPTQDIHVTGVGGSGSATTSSAIGLQDNRQQTGVTVHVNVSVSPETTTPGVIFNNFNPQRTDDSSPGTGQTKLQFENSVNKSDSSAKVKVHTCPGRKKPCGAVLRLNQNYCTQCKWKIDKTIFNTEGKVCKGRKEDGSVCNADIQEGARFCSVCGEDVVEDMSPVRFSCLGNTSEGEACGYISQHRFDTCPKCMCDSKPRGIRNEISCPGVKHPCDAKLTIEDNFCPQCKWKVKKELFLSESKCNGLAEDGRLCLAHIMSGDRFCSKCGNSVPKEPLSYGRSIKLSPDPRFMIPDQVKTKWELSNVQIGDYLISVMLCGQVAILSFLMVIHKKYKAILSEVSEGSLVFTFLHETNETAQLMIDDRHHVRQLIEDFLKELDDSVLYDHLDLHVELVTDTGAHDKTVEALGVDQLVMDAGVHDKTGGALRVDQLVTDTEAKDKTDEVLGVDKTSCEKDETEHRIPPSALCEPTHEESHGVYPVISLESMETACTDGNLLLVQEIISTSPNSVNIPSEHGDTPLMWASLGGHYDVVTVLLSHEVDVNVKNNRDETSLILACRKSLLHKTLDRGKESDITELGCVLAGDPHVRIEETSRDSEIYTSIVELLLSHGADERVVDDDGFTPLLLTCIFGDLRVTETLLSRGVNVNYTGIFGSTALMWACVFGHDNIVDRLVQAGAHVNKAADSNISALHISSYFGRDKIVNTLVAHGASVDEADDRECTPLHYAALFGFPDVINLLESHGAQTDKPDCGGYTPLMAASRSGQTGTVELLLKHGADVNHKNTDDWTPLLYSAMFGHTDTARLLLSHGAEADTRDGVDGMMSWSSSCPVVQMSMSQITMVIHH